MSRGVSRMPVLLALFGRADAPVTTATVMAATGWDVKVAHKTLANAKQLGYAVIDRAAEKHEGQFVHALTAAGEAHLLQHAAFAGGDSNSDAQLLADALVLLGASDAGLDSEQLAEQLVTSNERILAVLEPAVADHRLVACRLVRGGVEMRSYRKSIGTLPPSLWTKPLAATATAHEVAAARTRTQMAGIDIDRAHRVPSTGTIGKLTPPAAAAPLDSVTESSADDMLRYPSAAEAAAQAASEGGDEAALDAADHDEWFALFSTGELNVQRRDGSQVSFDADETRALFAWLDRLGGTNLSRLAAAEEAA